MGKVSGSEKPRAPQETLTQVEDTAIRDRLKNIRATIKGTISAVVVGVLVLGAYGASLAKLSDFVGQLGAGLIVAAAAFASGAILGFLFGIPRKLQDASAGVGTEGTLAEANRTSGRGYGANTNLEQISDWLTKILVGVGLTQIGNIGGGAATLADTLSSSFGGGDDSEAIALATVIYFLICGFLAAYLSTRLWLAGALREADVQALDDRIAGVQETASKALSQLEKQAEADAKALGSIERQLNPVYGLAAIEQDELEEYVRAASPHIKVQIFNTARDFRSSHWRTDKTKMERTIPVFKALISADLRSVYHRNHAQLGYALKDKTRSDLRAAEEELSKAIEIRGDWRASGWVFYEFNRAICRIKKDPGFTSDEASATSDRDAIASDLRAAASSDGLKKILDKDVDVQKWLKINSVHF